jgi:hypothetical protein
MRLLSDVLFLSFVIVVVKPTNLDLRTRRRKADIDLNRMDFKFD